MFAHEKLHVYAKGLDFASKVAAWTSAWDKRHALVDQLARAAESILSNLAEAARQHSAPGRLRTLDYAIGSSLECAGCLDVAQIKALLTSPQTHEEKRQLCEVTRMLIGLRKAWAESVLREDPPPPPTRPTGAAAPPLFHHENLEVYRAALAFMQWFVAQPQAEELPNRLFRQLDEAGTSIVLNIAEGNGRYSELDQHHFLQIAQGAAVKAAVYMDLGVRRSFGAEAEARQGKEHLRRISVMLGGF